MTLLQALAVAGAGLAAGVINSIAGSGSLITFPTLLAIGLPPLQANVSNSIGLIPGSVSGAYGYRGELRGNLRRVGLMSVPLCVGALLGAVLLLRLPPRVFEVVVPLLVLAASILVIAQPALSRALDHRGREGWGLRAGLFLVGVYAGYFGAAQGIMLLAVLGLFLDETLQRVNAFKILLAGLGACVAGIVFAVAAPVSWPFTVVLAGSSLAGGRLGASIARRVPDRPLRLGVGVFGVIVAVRLAVVYHLF
jgi:uncharacterized membrane protein YfcA